MVTIQVGVRENTTGTLRDAPKELKRALAMWSERTAEELNAELKDAFKQAQSDGPPKTESTMAWETMHGWAGNAQRHGFHPKHGGAVSSAFSLPDQTLVYTGEMERGIQSGPFHATYDFGDTYLVTFDGTKLPLYTYYHQFNTIAWTPFGNPNLGPRVIPARRFLSVALIKGLQKSEKVVKEELSLFKHRVESKHSMTFRYLGTPMMWAWALYPPGAGLQYIGMWADIQSISSGHFTAEHAVLLIEAMILGFIGLGRKAMRRKLRFKLYGG